MICDIPDSTASSGSDVNVPIFEGAVIEERKKQLDGRGRESRAASWAAWKTRQLVSREALAARGKTAMLHVTKAVDYSRRKEARRSPTAHANVRGDGAGGIGKVTSPLMEGI